MTSGVTALTRTRPRRRRRAARHLGRARAAGARARGAAQRRSTTSTSAPPAASARAARRRRTRPPQLVVVAVPPDHLADAVVEALDAHRRSGHRRRQRQGRPLAQVADHVGADALARYVGSHPMAGSERSGPLAASAALFDGRPWAVTPHAALDRGGGRPGRGAGPACGADAGARSPRRSTTAAVARTSHLPHLLAVLTAGQLADAPARAPLAVRPGRARRDPDRRGRPGPVGADPDRATPRRSARCCARCAPTSTAARGARSRRPGRAGRRSWPAASPARAAIPGKHGGPPRPRPSVFVVVPGPPGRAGAAVRRRRRDRASTSRTCASTTTRAVRSGSSSSWSRTGAPSRCAPRSRPAGWTTHR